MRAEVTTTYDPKRCEACGQKLPTSGSVRQCANCQGPILSHHKYRFENADGKSYLVHRHCDSPYSYEYENPSTKPPVKHKNLTKHNN